MRLMLVGAYTLDDFRDALSEVVDELKANDIDVIHGVNFYFRLNTDKTNVKLIDKNGFEIERLVFDYSKRKEFEPSSKDMKVVKVLPTEN